VHDGSTHGYDSTQGIPPGTPFTELLTPDLSGTENSFTSRHRFIDSRHARTQLECFHAGVKRFCPHQYPLGSRPGSTIENKSYSESVED